MRPENLQKIIGHANYSTTADVYIHLDVAALEQEMSKLKK
jgi:integrase